MKFFNKQKPNVSAQIGAMKSKYPQFRAKHITNDSVIFVGDLMIKPELPIYSVSVEYRGKLSPKVRVITPKLVDKPPHYYKNTDSLCLYHTDDFKWNCQKLVAKEIMSWTIAWIYFYEAWKQTDIWYGPESHHYTNTIKEDKDE
ncbi:MAG: hypothetical protein CVT99_05085 [Bacteroidetes bacterium HGW-Bacteroidetes-16]|nr:MAG: hypothetical protein CVT99_05085 [Bacteroidetes bacterium HGW-Bacteroidetes-16]